MMKSLGSLAALAGGLLLSAGLMVPAPVFAAGPSTPILVGLTPGQQGSAIYTLQADLELLGYNSVSMSGTYDGATEAAVNQFETEQGLPTGGATTMAFRNAMLAALRSGPSQPNGTNNSQVSSTPGTGQTIDGRPVLKVIHMIATAYGPSLQDNYPYGPVDAFGQPLQAGMVAVDPSIIPLHTYVWVTGYTDPNLPQGGFLGHAMDTGGAIQGNRMDIFMNANAETVSNFGIEPITVYVLGN
jgi:3D (Asp-Asp-Asp) domain-containing protein